MGQISEQYTYPITTSRENIFEELNAKTNGALDSIRWLDAEVLSDRTAAEKFIEDNDSGWYDCLAVPYITTETAARVRYEKTNTYKTLTRRLGNAVNKRNELDKKLFFADIKSEFVSCKNCRSKLAVAFMNSNFCPLCGQDMRSKTALDKIERCNKSITSIYTEIETERKRYKARKNKKTTQTVTMWLVKIEYYTD